MTVYLNNRFIPEDQAVVSMFDRGFLYGDGLFETIRVAHSRPFRWHDHMERLQLGIRLLRLILPCPAGELLAITLKLIAANHLTEGILRITLSRGRGARGYSPRGADRPTLLLSVHPLVPGKDSWKLITSTIRLPAGDPLASAKTANKLPQILARAEADDAGADDALLLNTGGQVAETSSGNLFWLRHGQLHTPPAISGIIPGVTRKVVLEIAANLRIPTREEPCPLEELNSADGVFATNSSHGIVEISHLDGRELSRSEFIAPLREGYSGLLAKNP